MDFRMVSFMAMISKDQLEATISLRLGFAETIFPSDWIHCRTTLGFAVQKHQIPVKDLSIRFSVSHLTFSAMSIKPILR